MYAFKKLKYRCYTFARKNHTKSRNFFVIFSNSLQPIYNIPPLPSPHSFPAFSLPYGLDLHTPSVTCIEYYGNCPEEFVASLHSVKSKMMCDTKSTKVGGEGRGGEGRGGEGRGGEGRGGEGRGGEGRGGEGRGGEGRGGEGRVPFCFSMSLYAHTDSLIDPLMGERGQHIFIYRLYVWVSNSEQYLINYVV